MKKEIKEALEEVFKDREKRPLLKVSEVANILKVSRATVYRLHRSGKLKKSDGFITTASLEDYLKSL